MKTLKSKQTHFEVLELAGEGLNSRVYKAFRHDFTGSIKQMVALKILKSKDSVSVWRQETHSLLQVRSPYCVQVFDFEWIENQPALVLEWLDGLSLTELFKTSTLNQDEAREILLQIQEGLIDLHLAGLCHGDLHMGNIFVTTEGRVKLIDFGWANAERIHEQGVAELRAPELNQKSAPDLWSDFFSLGRIASHLGILVPEFLASLPEDRDLMPGRKSGALQAQLAEKVNGVLIKQKFSRAQATEQMEASEKGGSHTLSLFALLFCSLTLSASSLVQPTFAHSSPEASSCTLEVRTRQWYEIRINNGSEVHYSPFTLTLSQCGSVQLTWKNQNESGELPLNLVKGQFLRLNDRDFRLDHSKRY